MSVRALVKSKPWRHRDATMPKRTQLYIYSVEAPDSYGMSPNTITVLELHHAYVITGCANRIAASGYSAPFISTYISMTYFEVLYFIRVEHDTTSVPKNHFMIDSIETRLQACDACFAQIRPSILGDILCGPLNKFHARHDARE